MIDFLPDLPEKGKFPPSTSPKPPKPYFKTTIFEKVFQNNSLKEKLRSKIIEKTVSKISFKDSFQRARIRACVCYVRIQIDMHCSCAKTIANMCIPGPWHGLVWQLAIKLEPWSRLSGEYGTSHWCHTSVSIKVPKAEQKKLETLRS